MSALFLDSFSGPVSDLPKGRRNATNVLAVLTKSPRVSTWDMDAAWLRCALEQLQRDGLISKDKSEPYPWHRYTLTAAGRAVIKGKS